MAERVEIVIEGQDRLSGPARTATSSLSSLERAAGTGAAGIGRLDTASRSAEASVGGLGTVMRTAAGTALGFAALGAVASIVSSFAGSFIGMNAQLETAKMQFTTLLGSAELAEERIAELYKFAAVTPFEFQEVLQASRALEMAGGAALATGKNLTMVGDAAAATGAPFGEVAMWTARMYAAMQAGRPFGEAAQRLQELMILAPDVRNELEALQKSGADGTKLWDVYTKAMGRYNGAMANLAGTFTGMLTTISDSINMALGALGKPLFNILKMGMQPSIDFLSGPVSDAFTRLGERAEIGVAGIGAAFGGIGRLIEDMLGAPINAAFDWGYGLMQAYADGIMNGASNLISGVASFVGDLIGSWFEAFSPPKILPDIDQWGAATMEAYLKGFQQADFSVFRDIGNVIESQLKAMVKLGQLPEEGLVPAIIGRRTDLAAAIAMMKSGQAVSQELLDGLTAGFGRAADAVKAYLAAEMAIIPATAAVEAAQQRLEEAQARLAAVRRGATGSTAGAEAEVEAAERRLSDLRLAHATARQVDAAQRNLEMARRRLADLKSSASGGVEAAQREVELAQDALSLARKQETSLQKQANLAKSLVDAMSDNKSLQVQMVEALEKAAKAAEGVGDNIAKGVSKATVEAKEKIISEFELAKKGVQERVAAFFEPLTTQAAKIGERLRVALGNIGITPEQITAVANALGRMTGILLVGVGSMAAWGMAAKVLGLTFGLVGAGVAGLTAIVSVAAMPLMALRAALFGVAATTTATGAVIAGTTGIIGGLAAILRTALWPITAILGTAFSGLGALLRMSVAPAISGIGLAFGFIRAPIAGITAILGGLINVLVRIPSPIAALGMAAAGLRGFLAALLNPIRLLSLAGAGLGGAFAMLAAPTGILAASLGGLLGALTSPLVIAIALSAAFAAWQTNIGGVQERWAAMAKAINAGDFQGAFDVLSAGIGELVAWIGTQAAPIIDQLGKWTDAFLSWAEQVLSPLMDKIGKWAAAFVAWIGPMISPFLARLGELIGKLLAWLGEQVGIIAGKLGEWALAFWEWIEPMIGPFLDALGELIGKLLAWLGEQVGPLVVKLGTWALAFLDWVGPMIPKLTDKLLALVSRLMTWITEQAPGLATKILAEWVPALIGFVAAAAIKLIPELLLMIAKVGLWIVTDGIPKLIEFGVKMGAAIILGFIQGLASLATEAALALSQVGQTPVAVPIEGEMPPPIEGMRRGGAAFPGRNYLVGEAGPELFAPRGAGTIIPNNMMRQNNDNREVTVNIYGGGDVQSIIDRFAADPRLKDYLQPKPRF